MYSDMKVAVAIPAYRAAKTVGGVVASLPAWIDFVVVVNDASPDDTAAALEAIKDPRLTVIHHDKNRGVGGAMITAFRKVIDLGADVVVKLDSDGQMDPTEIGRLLDAIAKGGFDYAKGNRFLHSEALESMPKHRLIGSLALTFLTKLASGYWHIFDPQNGFIACRVDVLKHIDLDSITSSYFFENDMLVHLNILQRRVTDIPMPARYGTEQSSMRIWRIMVSFPIRLFFRFWKRIYQRYVLRDFSPVAVFLSLGLPMLLWGPGFGAYAWYQSATSGIVTTAGTVMIAALPLIIGFQLVLQAIVLDIQSTPR